MTTDGTFKELRKVSDANPQKANLLWGTSELVQFKNADGVPLTGALYKPENFDPTKKYPMMVYIYERLTQNVQPLRGSAPQPQSSTSATTSATATWCSRRTSFTPRAIPGQSALKCVLPGVQAMVDKGFVDEKTPSAFRATVGAATRSPTW